MSQNAPVNGFTPSGAKKLQSASQVSSTSPAQTGNDYDFSSLTKGLFSKPWRVASREVNAGLVRVYTERVILQEK